jgi:hypothetical protein
VPNLAVQARAVAASVVLILASGGTTACGSSSGTACGSSSGPAVQPGSGLTTSGVHAATVKACGDILAFEDSKTATSTFDEDPASARALRDARHTPLEADLVDWIKAIRTTAGDYSDAAMTLTDTTASHVQTDCGSVGVPVLVVPPGLIASFFPTPPG